MPDERKTKRPNYHHGDLAAALLKAAELELADRGIEAFSLRAVAKRAGVSHGAPAHHFGDANGLLTALAAQGYRRLSQMQARRRSEAAPDPASQFTAGGLGYIDFAEANPALFRLMFVSERPDRSDPAFAEASLQTYRQLVADARSVLGSSAGDEASLSAQIAASWALAHGLSDLLISGRLAGPLGPRAQKGEDRDAVLADILRRALPDGQEG